MKLRRVPESTRSLAEYDELARVVHAAIEALEEAGRIDDGDADSSYGEFNGYCARACAAYSYLAEHEPAAESLCKNPDMRLKRLKQPGADYGNSHYWLEDPDGRVLDLIFRDRKRLPRDIPYHEGKGATVRKDRRDKALPAAKDTQRIISVVRALIS